MEFKFQGKSIVIAGGPQLNVFHAGLGEQHEERIEGIAS